MEGLVQTAAVGGYETLALTDRENLWGQVQFHHQCRICGICPICGVALLVNGDTGGGASSGIMVLLAMDGTGYRNLCRIVSMRRRGLSGNSTYAVQLANGFAAGLLALADDLSVLQGLIVSGKFSREHLGLLVVRPSSFAGEAASIESARQLGVQPVADQDVIFYSGILQIIIVC